jgi:hypothetical protein
MTKKDYVKLADAVARQAKINVAGMEWISKTALVKWIMPVLSEDNPRFSRERFWVACGLKREDL